MRVRRYPNLLLAALGAGTAAWLALQIAVSLVRDNDLWPISPVSMLVLKKQQAGHIATILVRTSTGRVVHVRAADIGAPSIHAFTARLIATDSRDLPHPAPGASDRLRKLVDAWNRKHPSERARSAVLRVETIPLARGKPSVLSDVAAWP